MATVPGFESAVFPYTTDIPFLDALGRSRCCSVPGSIHVAHTADEFVSIAELHAAVGPLRRHRARAAGARRLTWSRARSIGGAWRDWTAAIARGDRTHLAISNARLVVAALGAVFAVARVRQRDARRRPGSCSPVGGVRRARRVSTPSCCSASSARAARSASTSAASSGSSGRWAGAGRDGARYLDHHPYARDLDLFGPASLFELLEHRADRSRRGHAGRLAAGAAATGRDPRAAAGGRRAAADARLSRGRVRAGGGSRRRPHGRAGGVGRGGAGTGSRAAVAVVLRVVAPP